MSRISFTELVNKIQSKTITASEVSRFFMRAPSATPRFAPDLAINEMAVDIGGMEIAARHAGPSLGFQAVQVVRAVQLAAAGAPQPNGTIIAEGDSWFNLPELGFPINVPPTLSDFLAHKYPINDIAHWGDELQDMVTRAEYMPFLITGNVKYLLFSGGGNDVVGGGNLAAFLRQRVSGDNDPQNAPAYVKPAYFTMLSVVEGLFRSMITAVLQASPATKILIHGYDYVIPLNQGRLLGEPLRFRGFDPVWNKELARAIVRFMLDAHNARLQAIADDHPLSVRHVNLLGTVKANEWWDELHPKRNAAKKLAAKFDAVLQELEAVA